MSRKLKRELLKVQGVSCRYCGKRYIFNMDAGMLDYWNRFSWTCYRCANARLKNYYVSKPSV